MTTSTLKLLALFFMILDHIGYFFPQYDAIRVLGRMSAPIFFFCFVEGYNHTHDREKYKQRLAYFSVLMCIINFQMIYLFKFIGHPLPSSINILVPNVIFTLFVMFLILEGVDNQQYYKLLAIILIPFTEYSYYAFYSVLIFRYVKDKRLKMYLFCIVNFIICLLTKNTFEIPMIFSSLLLWFYNGKNGKFNTKLFYILYPLNFYFIKLISIL